MTSPLVSIITPTFNAEDTIEETLASVSAQTFDDWEHLIIDDVSLDATVARITAAAKADPRRRVLTRASNGGAAHARNDGILAASGRYIAFLDADDLWAPDKLARQIGYMQDTGAPFTFTGWWRIDVAGRVLGGIDAPARATYESQLKDNRIGCLTAVYDTAALGRVEMPIIRKRQDLGLWLRLLKLTDAAHGLPERLASYRVRPGSVSSNRLDAARYTWKLYREVEHLPLGAALYYFSHYAVRRVLPR